MDQLQLFINDQLVDLSDDSPIALTFQINNLAEVQNQQGHTSNQFKLPLTQRNRQILGFPDDVAIATNLPYQQYQAKLVQDGLEIVPYGIAELNGIEQDTASVTILSGNVDFFDALGGKLYDMGDRTSVWSNYGQSLLWNTYDHVWSVDSVAGSQEFTDGWIWPVVDYGAIDEAIFSNPIDVRYQRPGFFIKTAIELLVKSSGYTATGSLLSDPLYPLMIPQFANGSFEHGTDYQNQVDKRGLIAGMQAQVSLRSVRQYFTWDTIIDDPSSQFDGTVFRSSKRNTVTVTVSIPHLYLEGFVSATASSLTMYIYYRDPQYPTIFDVQLSSFQFGFDGHGERQTKPGIPSDPNGWTRLNGSDGSNLYASIDLYNSTISTEAELPANGGIYIGWQFSGRTPSTSYVSPGLSLTIKSKNELVQFGDMIQCERIFPDISQKDLLKDTFQRFGIICQTDNASKTVSFNSLKDIVNNIPIAKDWSSKCLNQGKQVSFQLGNYAQLNYMQYQTDQNILPLTYGWSQINVSDLTLPATATLFQSPFGPSLFRPYYGGSIAQITMIDTTSSSEDFSISVAPRILIDQKYNLGEQKQTITFTDGNGYNRLVNGKISTPYFYKPDAPSVEGYGQLSLMFDDLRKQYYPHLEKILKQTKKVVRYILLTPRDILELDLMIPVFIQQDSAYYYINKIDSWRKGQPTKVELVKLG